MKQKDINMAWRGAQRCKKCGIRHLALFANIKQTEFDRLHLPIEDIGYEPGECLYRQGDCISAVSTIRSGLVKLVQRLPNGDRRIVRILGQGDLAGLEGMEGQPMDHDAITMDYVRVCRIPCNVIVTLRRDNPELHQALLQRWHRALAKANAWITRLSTGHTRERVARLLLLLDETAEDDTIFLPSRDDIGDMLGITTESASRATAEFRRQGWLKPLPEHRAWVDSAALAAAYE